MENGLVKKFTCLNNFGRKAFRNTLNNEREFEYENFKDNENKFKDPSLYYFLIKFYVTKLISFRYIFNEFSCLNMRIASLILRFIENINRY